MSTFAINKVMGVPLRTIDNGDGTCTLVTVLSGSSPQNPGSFALNKDRGLPLLTRENEDGTCSLVIAMEEVGNIFWVKESQRYTIPDNRENICTSPFLLEGALTIDGRLTVL